MTIKDASANVYDTLQALHAAVAEIDPSSGLASAGAEQGVVDALEAHHIALNELRKLVAEWPDFLAFIEREEPQARSGGSNKDNPPPGPK